MARAQNRVCYTHKMGNSQPGNDISNKTRARRCTHDYNTTVDYYFEILIRRNNNYYYSSVFFDIHININYRNYTIQNKKHSDNNTLKLIISS